MDLGPDEAEFGEERGQTQKGEEIQNINTDAGSPMQQSPDQSDFNDNYRSPETSDLTTQDDHMDTNEGKVESPGAVMENEDTANSEPESDNKEIEEKRDNADESDEVNIQVAEGPESPAEVDSSGELDQINEIDDSKDESIKELGKNEEREEDGKNESIADIDNEIESSHQGNENELQSEKIASVDESNITPITENENQQNENSVSSVEEATVDKFEPDNTITEGGTEADNVSSNVDSVFDKNKLGQDSNEKFSQDDQDISEMESQSPRSQEVSSTSVDKDIPEQSGNISDSSVHRISSLVSKMEDSESKTDEDIFKYPTSDIVLVSNLETSKPDVIMDSLARKGQSSLDDFSVTSVIWSSDSDNEDNELDLTKSETDGPRVDMSTNESDNVSSSTNNIQEITDKDKEVEEPEVQTENKENNTEEERTVTSATNQVEERKADTELEEVSDEEEEEEDIDENDAEKEERQVSMSGMEEVSSEEEDEQEDEKGEEKKMESGMEEVSDEEEESEGERESESGMENVSSDEEDDIDDDRKEEKVKTDESRTVEVKQNGEVVTIDDTEKADGDIVKEVLENITIKIANKSEDSEDLASKRRKSKEKKERRESAKPKSKSSIKDTRDINERLKAQASYGDDVELDYDDTVHEEGKEKQASDSEGEITSDSSSSDGEIEEEECEEGEIKEPGQKPFVKPKCRFFMRGHCTWGINCRFLHPGVNDKGNYQLIDRPGFNNRPPQPYEEKWEEEEVERTPSPEPPPPPPEPKEETAWERGLRQAKELRRKAMERREMETNFEHKKMNLSIEDNPEFDKENVDEVEKPVKKSPVKKTPYYDKYEPLSDDEYYDQTPMRLRQKQMEQSWMPGQYENFEVYWSQDQMGPPHPQGSYPPPPQGSRYPYPNEPPMRGRERAPLRPSPRRYSMSPPPRQRERQMRVAQRSPHLEMVRREKIRDERMPSPPPKHPASAGRGRPKADEWNDPWTRANAAKGRSPKKRSRSRGRRRSRRSYSNSSYSSSSYSGSSRSRSRSSSYSSVSSRSSRSSSLSRSRSPASRPGVRRGVPGANQPVRRPSTQMKTSEPPKSSVAVQGRAGRVPEKRPGGVPNSRPTGLHSSPSKAVKPSGPSPGKQPPNRGSSQQIVEIGRGKKPPQKTAAPLPQPQRKFQMAVKTRDRPLPQSAFSKDKGKPNQPTRRRKTSSSSSRSRSRSRSSSSSSRSSYSSGSSLSRSRSRSRSSSASSSGSADSDHLYRNIGSRENQKPMPAGRGMPDSAKHGRMPAAGQGRPGLKPGETSRPSSVAQAKVVKDPMKMTGQKSNIKLTLIKPGEKPPPGTGPESLSRKRPAEPGADAPPLKRPSVTNPPKIDKPVKKPEKATPVSPTKAPGRPQGIAKPSAPGAPAAVAMATVKKKSTVSRREELLKQLKAVEDAIAKKKKKMS